MSNKETYFTNTVYYSALPMIRNAIAFLTLPIMTRYLKPADYGVISLMTMLVGFGTLFTMGFNNASCRFYFKYKDEPAVLKRMLSTNMIFIVGATILYSLSLILLFPWLNKIFFQGHVRQIWLGIMLWQYSLIYINMINQNILQNQHQGWSWLRNELVALLIQIPLSVGLVLTGRLTYGAIMIAGAVAETVKATMLFGQLKNLYGWRYDWQRFWESFAYSWPQTPTVLISYLYSYLDKMLLSQFRGLTQVGILDMSGRFSLILKAANDGVSGTLSPLTLELLAENKQTALKKLADVNLKVACLLLTIALLIILFSKEIIMLLMTREYYSTIYILPLYIYYNVFGILGMITYWQVHFNPAKTYWSIPLNLIALIANTAANLILVPIYGAGGAAVATFFSSGIAHGAQVLVGNRLTPLPLAWVKLWSLFGLVFTETVSLYAIYAFSLPLLAELGLKLLMFLLFLIAVWLMRVIVPADVRMFYEILGQKIKGRFFTQARIASSNE